MSMDGDEGRRRLSCRLLWMVVVGILLSGGAVVCGQSDEDSGGGGVFDASAPEAQVAAANAEMVPAMFIFGDSLIDNGNNNDLASLAKANYYPYGIDFNGGPTGRFSNGYTMVDAIAELLGLPLIPAYSQASNSADQMLHGVNFASAAAGILDITGRNFQLYNLGARKFVLAGIGLMGCIPSILAQGTTGRCSDEVNQLVLPFNANMKTMINNLSVNLPGSKFVFIDVHNMFQDILANARFYGFRVVNRGCCGIGRNRGQITCLPLQTPCPNRNEYVFWDAFHPTEAVNVLMGRKAFSGTPDVVYPINIQQLANL
ncbi:Lipase, GDSL [Cynara cardunculus var. scolymus]|uniref:Lipase, GDSL n=1 Tax=Cynara cardunculus var. scolymus TaxID=59895 RepID=A0A103XYX2_CYNCS|nr:Lipase, GDSL [Cynara cardunculus var. scolymus]